MRGLCLEPHDLVISKLVAGREKDLEFCAAAVRRGVVSLDVLRERLDATELDDGRRSLTEARLRAFGRTQER